MQKTDFQCAMIWRHLLQATDALCGCESHCPARSPCVPADAAVMPEGHLGGHGAAHQAGAPLHAHAVAPDGAVPRRAVPLRVALVLSHRHPAAGTHPTRKLLPRMHEDRVCRRGVCGHEVVLSSCIACSGILHAAP